MVERLIRVVEMKNVVLEMTVKGILVVSSDLLRRKISNRLPIMETDFIRCSGCKRHRSYDCCLHIVN